MSAMIAPQVGMAMALPRAGDGVRTHDNDVGNVVLYQLSYTRTIGPTAEGRPFAPGGIPKL